MITKRLERILFSRVELWLVLLLGITGAILLVLFGWLVHHEFGADHRPFVFAAAGEPVGDPGSMEYWLQLWINVYHWLLENRDQQSCFVSYEQLCETNGPVRERLYQRLGLARDGGAGLLHAPKTTDIVFDNEVLRREATRVHERLIECSIGKE